MLHIPDPFPPAADVRVFVIMLFLTVTTYPEPAGAEKKAAFCTIPAPYAPSITLFSMVALNPTDKIPPITSLPETVPVS